MRVGAETNDCGRPNVLVAWIQQDDALAPSEAPLLVEAGSAPVKR